MRRCLRALAGAVLIASLGAGLALPAQAGGRAASAKRPGTETKGLYLQLIRHARTEGRVRAALAYLDDFERQYSDDPEARALRINCLLDLGDVQAAQALVARLPKATDNAEIEAVRGHVLAADGRWADAVVFYETAVQLAPADALALNALGYARLRAGQPASALDSLRAAVDLAPGAAVFRNNLLLALLIAGDDRQVEARLAGLPEVERTRLRGELEKEAARVSGLAGIAWQPRRAVDSRKRRPAAARFPAQAKEARP